MDIIGRVIIDNTLGLGFVSMNLVILLTLRSILAGL